MKTSLLILGTDNHPDTGGRYNRALHQVAIETLSPSQTILTTEVDQTWDIKTEAEKFLAADTVIFQFPVFWYMPPAGLKHYMDSVYQHGIMFGGVKPDGTAGLLSGRYMLSATWNAPAAHFDNPDTFFSGCSVDNALIAMRKSQEFLGLSPLPHFHCHEVQSSPDIARDKTKYRAHLKKVFSI